MSEQSHQPQGRFQQQRPIQYLPLSPLDFTCELVGEPVGRPSLADFMVVPPEWLILDEHLQAPGPDAVPPVEPVAAPVEEPAPVEAAERELLEQIFAEAGRDCEDVVLHSLRVGMLAQLIARELGASEDAAQQLRRAAVLHDIGKVVIPEAILDKPGLLREDEIESSKLHTVVGAELLDGSTLPVIRLARIVALHHHERWDGTGYPDRLTGEETPMVARIVGIADVFDALTHERPYKPAWSMEEAARELLRQRGRLHEESVVDALLRVLEKAGVKLGVGVVKAEKIR